jgi:hypothetical protein
VCDSWQVLHLWGCGAQWTGTVMLVGSEQVVWLAEVVWDGVA